MQILRLDFRQAATRRRHAQCVIWWSMLSSQQDRMTAVAFAAGLIVGLASTIAHAQAPAFQGHAAETQQRSDLDERRRRALYFDTVDLEIGPPGLPCDHLALKRPEVTAGTGFVVLARISGAPPATARIWFPPGSVSRDVAQAAQAMLVARFPEAGVSVTDSQRFVWCR